MWVNPYATELAQMSRKINCVRNVMGQHLFSVKSIQKKMRLLDFIHVFPRDHISLCTEE